MCNTVLKISTKKAEVRIKKGAEAGNNNKVLMNNFRTFLAENIILKKNQITITIQWVI